jgi:D-alanyl-D-alanine carboxypeptidase
MDFNLRNILVVLLAIVALCGGAFIWWQDKEHQEAVALLEGNINTKKNELALKESVIVELSTQLEMTAEELDDTEDRLRDEKDRNDDMEDQVRELAGTVSDLDKLSRTDKELLQKYSKVSFLNEHYIPEALSEIDNEWKYTETRSHKLHTKVLPFFEDMLEDAKGDGIELWVTSSYRSFYDQATLKGAYTVTYGSGANAFSADQGFSEHQLGTTIDFTTTGMSGGLSNTFATTPAYAWLKEHAHKYGFALSYPQNNAYYVYEPWHWRFVGVDLATDLHREGSTIYDWEQRDIDQYLLHIFD